MRFICLSAVTVAAGAVLLVGGCDEYTASTKASSPIRRVGYITFGFDLGSEAPVAPDQVAKRVPGVSHGAVSFGVKDGKTLLIVWADGKCEESSCGVRRGDEFLRGDKFLCRSGYGEVACECVLSDGKTDTCWIGVRNARWPAEATSYHLADGAFFLLSTQGAKPRVRQMQRDLTNIASEMKVIEGLARSDAEIRDFFMDHKAAE